MAASSTTIARTLTTAATAMTQPTIRPLRLLLVRHAQSMANIQHGIITGRSNHVALTELGVRQSQALAARWHRYGPALHAVYSSTAVRAMATCHHVCNAIHYPRERVITTEHLLERDMSAWVGLHRDAAWTQERMAAYHQDPYQYIPGVDGESVKIVEERMMNYIHDHIVPLRLLPKDTPAIGNIDTTSSNNNDKDNELLAKEFSPDWVNGNTYPASHLCVVIDVCVAFENNSCHLWSCHGH
jgi:bisphosphoglycerate-dependent phosphoglycerate mutase